MAKELKLSPWHDMYNTPTKVGPYELKQPHGESCVYSWWDGFFHGAWPTIEYAYNMRNWPNGGYSYLATAWRGVLK